MSVLEATTEITKALLTAGQSGFITSVEHKKQLKDFIDELYNTLSKLEASSIPDSHVQ